MFSIESSIIDNQGDNTLLRRLEFLCGGGNEIAIASAFFSLDALMLIAEALVGFDKIRILFGDDADAKQRVQLLALMRRHSDEDLLAQREALPTLKPLQKIETLIAAGKVEARCYTKKKFHAKASLVTRSAVYPPQMAVLGSGNFTRAGLLQNVELNCQLTTEQTAQLADWFEARWAEAKADDITPDLLREVRRQIDLYAPYALYLKALFAWGAQLQDDSAVIGGPLKERLDPHQELGFRQALRILERENGVMICDGVGLGKSFIALALMERRCRQGKRVLLIAPKAILTSSWVGYLETYLGRYRAPFGSIYEQPMTAFGFDYDTESGDPKTQQNIDLLTKLAERADVIVIDESHNFRTPSSSRYKNLMRIVAPSLAAGRKETILLTATPINTAYRDLSAQMALITHSEGSIAGYPIATLNRAAAQMDIQARNSRSGSFAGSGQLNLGLLMSGDEKLRTALESVVIQRSRRTCRELAAAAGKELRFPQRRDPEPLEYAFTQENDAYKELVELTEDKFRPGIELYKKLRAAQREAQDTKKAYDRVKILRRAGQGIKLAAFLPEQYANEPSVTTKRDSDEIHLAGLVFANTLKQLESSPVAFQGILQSLGMGLIARLNFVLGEAKAAGQTAPHKEWIRTSLFPKREPDSDDSTTDEADALDDLVDDGEALDAAGAETEDWLTKAIQERGLAKKLALFSEKTHDVARWASDIENDLGYLKEIHAATLKARQQPDPKLARVVQTLQEEMNQQSRVLVFTQSRRTALYLESELRARFPNRGVARLDSGNAEIRPAVLHAFSPGYNPPLFAASVPKRVDILISTDVLSEGVNLQEAGAILNYDIHWNPVRLIQRIGRVDRRLDPAITPETHTFAIYNVLPPDDIESVLDLVGKVEDRTLKISRTLGLDVSFFKATDRAGTLKEFNAQYEGDLTATDHALKEYVRRTESEKPDAKMQAMIEALPPGAFGVWANAPCDALFALFTLEATGKATDADRERFAAVLGKPVLALQKTDGVTSFEAGEILELLRVTTPPDGSAPAPSGFPSEEAALSARVKKIRNAIRDAYREANLPQSIAPKLVCWMELRK